MKENKLENLLNDLKKETMSDYVEPIVQNNESKATQNDEKKFVDYNFTVKEEHSLPSKFNVIWSENKETLLFSILSSLILIVIGLISSYDYLVVVGAISFMIFSVLVFITFFRYVLVAYNKSQIPQDLLNRISVIEKKLEFISKKEVSIPGGSKLSELESEVREIKSVIKTLLSSFKK